MVINSDEISLAWRNFRIIRIKHWQLVELKQCQIMKVLKSAAVALACLSGQALGRAVSHRSGVLNVFEHNGVEQRALLQDIVSKKADSALSRFKVGLGCADSIGNMG